MRLEVSINLPASPTEVWQHIADLSRSIAWTSNKNESDFTSDITEGVGTTLNTRFELGPLHTTDFVTVTEWQPPDSGAAADSGGPAAADSATDPATATPAADPATTTPAAIIGIRHAGAVTGEGRHTLTKSEDGTLVKSVENLKLPWWMGGAIASPLTARLLRRVLWQKMRRLRVQIMEMNESKTPNQPGALIGRGKSTEVRSYGEHAIRISVRGDDLSHEANAMAHVGEHGFPAPKLISQPDSSSIVMERLSGPTMLQAITAKPWLLPKHAKSLAALHHQLGSIAAPNSWTQVSAGSGVCHLDMHPDNVKVTRNGLVVIDWSRAARGDAAFDAALTYVTLRTTPYAAGAMARTMVAGFRRQFAEAFARAFGSKDIMLHMRSAAELRLLDPNLLMAERESVFALARGELE